MLDVEIGDIVFSGRSSGFHRVLGFENSIYQNESVVLVLLKQVLTSTFKPTKTPRSFKHRIEDVTTIIDTDWLLEKQKEFEKNMSVLVKAMEGEL